MGSDIRAVKKKSSELKKKKTTRPRLRPAGAIRDFILSHVSEHPRDIVALTAKQFQVSQVAVQKHMRQLVAERRLAKEGQTRGTKWSIIKGTFRQKLYEINEDLGEDKVWRADIATLVPKDIPANVRAILHYGFTEMFNNAIDHSGGNHVLVDLTVHGSMIEVRVTDDGVGIFAKIQGNLRLSDVREGILELTKGKLTTDPTRHSGEGIFFTSRVFDRFEIESQGLAFIKDNLQDDWLIDSRDPRLDTGTIVVMRIRQNAETDLTSVFATYTDPETHRFDRTHIIVELAKNHETEYVSRSQAKRVLAGLEKFQRIILDFRNVRTVGQAFVDEVFRVFQNAHPDIRFEIMNTNENVDFMIKRGRATAGQSV